MKKITNKTHYEGYLFSHTLEKRVTGEKSKVPGTNFIMGVLNVATDEEGLNVVPIRFNYITAVTKKGDANKTYAALANIIDNAEGKTYEDVKTDAMKLRVISNLGINDFYNQEGELVSPKINENGFVTIINKFPEDEASRNSFELDMLITGAILKEADADKGTPEMLTLKGTTFNYAGRSLPLELVVKNEAGIKHFLSLEPSNAEPVFLNVWGRVTCSTVETSTVDPDNAAAFGTPVVHISTRSFREWEVTGAASLAYNYGDEEVLTEKEVVDSVAARETYLADVKKRADEYKASKQAPSAAPSMAASATPAAFNF